MTPWKLFITACLLLSLAACAATSAQPPASGEIAVVESWSGDYPVAELQRLPAGQRQTTAGFIDDPATFSRLWQAFRPGDPVPTVDFEKNLVVFSRNTDFYNRLRVFKVEAERGLIEVLTMETRSAMPIEDKAAMALAVIPRRGVLAIKVGDDTLPIP